MHNLASLRENYNSTLKLDLYIYAVLVGPDWWYSRSPITNMLALSTSDCQKYLNLNVSSKDVFFHEYPEYDFSFQVFIIFLTKFLIHLLSPTP